MKARRNHEGIAGRITRTTAAKILLAGAGLFAAIAAPATLIFSDTFSYPDGAITDVSGGLWIEDSGTNDAANALPIVSGQAQISRSRTECVHAALGQTYATGNGTMLYSGFTINFTSLPAPGGAYFIQYNTGSLLRCRVLTTISNAAAGCYRLSIGNSSGVSPVSGPLTNDLALNTTYTIVTRYNVDTGYSTLWINPTAETDASVTATDAPGPTAISSIRLRQAGSMGIMLIDNLKIGTAFADAIGSGTKAPEFTTQPSDQSVTVGGDVSFSATATGLPAPTCQWQFNSTNLPNATNATLILTNVQPAQAGVYAVIASNSVTATNSNAAMLTVFPARQVALTVVSYNTGGDTATNDWSTNALQVQAIGRQLAYLNPDIVALNEIPNTNTWQMANWIPAFLPGYYLATNSASDGFIRSVILSRHPITRSTSYLHGSSLTAYDATVTNGFTRDLFEAQLNVPGIARALHVFITHLKSTSSTPYYDAARRAAEAAAISNYLATAFLAANPNDLYLLAGDLNEDINRSSFTNQPIQHLVNAATGLQLTTPRNPYNNDDRTISIQTGLSDRLDYILPCGLLFSNIVSSQIFRTDLLTPTPANLQTNDDKTASDHLPVVMTFANPYARPRILALTRTNQNITLKWESAANLNYRVETSSNLTDWSLLAGNLPATATNFIFTTNLTGNVNFFRVGR